MSTANEENSKIIEKRIQDAFVMKASSGEETREICDKFSKQLYHFMVKTPNFTNEHISRGLREIIIEKNRKAIINSLLNTYLKYISSNSRFQNKNDSYIKSQLEQKQDINVIAQIILSNEEMINRIRTSNC